MTKNFIQTVPRGYLILSMISIGLNVLMGLYIALFTYVDNSDDFDYAKANAAISIYCSDDFRQTIEKTNAERNASENDAKKNLALVDYPCTRNGAAPFYEKGFNEYAQSIGITQND
jgi:hypothetical protein